ncbi:unnamed protein product [Cuscuta europaea]|uniref:BHLH domain-containing protein n=1 Tax=Cuscuta europaea TaxID=41803 RepID=A0A9P0YIE4_CUSEU|nr:unnamed protein product [Cuscuta europaea]
MADDDSVGGAGTISQLLFDANDVVVSLGTGSDGCLNFTSSSSGHPNASNMLCFGTEDDLRPIKKKRKNNGEEMEDVDNQNRGNYCKKKKPSGTAHATKQAKRRESLGDRIAALQKLVSPFGKGDTASVLQEAKSYLRFLHDQIQALSSPYLKNQPTPHGGGGGGGEENRAGLKLRNRGLCLIPVDLTSPIASHSPPNGADFWSPAAVSGSAQTKNPTHRNN